MSVDIMIDLETMGNSADAAILSIGACAMSAELGIGSAIYRPVSLASSIAAGGVVDASTVLWWAGQGDKARATLGQCDDTGMEITTALAELMLWMDQLGPKKERRVWGNGADFDLPILASAIRRSGFDVPWHHWNSRCYRTLKSLHRQIPQPEREGIHHHAMDDAMHQARHWVEIMRGTSVVVVTPASNPPRECPFCNFEGTVHCGDVKDDILARGGTLGNCSNAMFYGRKATGAEGGA